jgi:molybdopterin-guanine dinucleotide biosynthesis protein B
MPVLIAIVGDSGSGKTSVIEKLTRALVAKRFKVGAVKHSSHGVFDLKGKDTRRLRDAGADIVVGVTNRETMIVKGTSVENLLTIEEMMRNQVDVIFVEGYTSLVCRNERILKIVVANHPKALSRFLHTLKGRVIVLTTANLKIDLGPKFQDLVHIQTDKFGKLLEMVEEEVSQRAGSHANNIG